MLLPTSLLPPQKLGFGQGLPLANLMRKELSPLIQHVIFRRKIGDCGLFLMDRLLAEYDRLLAGHQEGITFFWHLFVFGIWFEVHMLGIDEQELVEEISSLLRR